MGNLTVVVLGKPGYSSTIAKKGTSTDITLYNLKKGENTVTLVEPSRYPERLAPLFYACSIAKKAIVVIDELNSILGESLVMLQSCGIVNGCFVLRNYITPDKIRPLVKDTVLENYKVISDDPIALKEMLLAEAAKIFIHKSMSKEEPLGTVPVDHAFNVKGIGVVILGIVAKGVITVHASMNMLPGTKTTQIRSIQKHDDNFDLSNEGDRVGLALKNIKITDVDRGTVLTSDPKIKSSKQFKTVASLVKYWTVPLKVGMVLHLGHWMQYIKTKIEAINNGGNWRRPNLTLSLEKEMVYNPGDTAVLVYLEGGKLRVAGTIEMP